MGFEEITVISFQLWARRGSSQELCPLTGFTKGCVSEFNTGKSAIKRSGSFFGGKVCLGANKCLGSCGDLEQHQAMDQFGPCWSNQLMRPLPSSRVNWLNVTAGADTYSQALLLCCESAFLLCPEVPKMFQMCCASSVQLAMEFAKNHIRLYLPTNQQDREVGKRGCLLWQ